MSADPDAQPLPQPQDDPALWPLLRVLAGIARRAAAPPALHLVPPAADVPVDNADPTGSVGLKEESVETTEVGQGEAS